MSSIGPQLPPHLAKRKRTPDSDSEDDATGPQPPPSKTSRTNEAEISLDSDDDDDDGFGPSAVAAPKSSAPTNPPSPPARTVGPTMPPPAPADHTTSQPQPTRRILGPTAPPASLDERPTADPDSESDSDSDYGPALPSSAAAHRAAALFSTVATTTTSSPDPATTTPAPNRRDDWMVVPPPPTSGPDPTKIKARGFATGRAAQSTASSSGAADGGIGSLWTETAAQRQARILNRPDPSHSSSTNTAPSSASSSSNNKTNNNPADDARDAAIRARIQQSRGRSMYEEHHAARKRGERVDDRAEEDDPSKRAFDREKDMAVAGRVVSNAQRRDMVRQAADFGGRFSKGSFL